jgi:predicted acetyltransferase
MDASYPIRPVDESELPAFVMVGIRAFNSAWPLDGILEHDLRLFEPERSLAAFDDKQIVGTTIAYTFDLTVPGGSVPAAGVSGVSVEPSHRRRGILSALMGRQLGDVAQGPEPVAILFASEAGIYGRFGYGKACDHYMFTVKRGDGHLRPSSARTEGAASGLALRIADPQTVRANLAKLYDAIRPTRPGMINRSDGRWELALSDPEWARDGSTPQGCVIAEDHTGLRGYALYSGRGAWDSDGVPDGSLHVRELFGLDPDATVALWANLLNRDLVGKVTARPRPVDDPLPNLLTDPRRTRTGVSDGLWVRLVDVPEALRRRCYAAQVDVVIEVHDALNPANEGRWRLTAPSRTEPAQPVCERTSAPADVVMPVSALGAAYLGGTRLGGLAAAGQIAELRPGALAELSAALWWDPAPWSPVMF